MQIIIENVKSRLLIGGADNLVDPKLIDHLRDYFSVEVPGAFFARKHLKYHWNGKKYFLTEKGAFATGFLPTMLKFLDEEYKDLEVKIVDRRENLVHFKPDFVHKIGNQTMYDHQVAVIKAYNNHIKFREYTIPFYQGIADCATNAGKSLIMSGTLMNLEGEPSMLVIIHRKTIYRELVEYFESVFGEVGQINDQNYKIGKRVTIAMIQSLSRKIDQATTLCDLAKIQVVCVDESHYSGSAMYSKVLVHVNAPVRMGLSGSAIDSNDIVSKMVIIGLFGPRLSIIAKRELMDKGISTPVTVYMHLVNTVLHQPILEYEDCIQQLIYESAERINIIANLIKDRTNVLIAVDKIKHGEYIQEQLRQRGILVELTHSKDRDIEGRVARFKTGELPVIISTGVLKEGVNIKILRCLIYCVGNQSKISVKQWMGRTERLYDGKESVEFHDFFDIGPFVNKFSKTRLKTYYDENLPVMLDFDLHDAKKMRQVIVK